MSSTLDESALLRSFYAQVHAVQIRLELSSLRFLSIDHNIGAITAIPPAAWLRPDFWDLHLHPDERVLMRLARSKAQVISAPLELRFRVATDASEYIAVRIVCARDDHATMRGFLVPAHERATPRAASYFRDRLAVAVETGAVFLSEVDVARRIERADARLSALLGFNPGELLTLAEWLERVVPEDRERVAEHHTTSFAPGAAHSVSKLPAIEYRVRSRDDRLVSLRRESRVWRGRHGAPERVIAAIQEIGDSVAAAATPSAAAIATDAMLEAIPGFAAVLDARGNVHAANDAWRRATDDGRFIAAGANYTRALRKQLDAGMKEAEPIIAALERVLGGKTAHVVTDHAWPAHGATQRWTFIAQRLGSRGGALVIHRPMIARHQAAELSVLGDATDRVVQLAIAGELLSSITHDLRQPLTALRLTLSAALELARRAVPDDPELAAIIADALVQEERVSRKLAVVQDLVAHRAPASEPVDLAAVVQEVALIAKTEAIGRRVPFQSREANHLPTVFGDRRLIRAAMLGLVLDALGALTDTAPARVTLTARVVDDAQVEVAVCRFADEAPPSADWVLSVARAVADVDSAPITVDSDGKTRSCVRLRWRPHTGIVPESSPG
ncbi:MAG TPA: PAS domain-containing protein [Gemmatimonadaceae bacterium]|nr:PAS domain-containing protein [Gemmatimonadaceae bacterium]